MSASNSSINMRLSMVSDERAHIITSNDVKRALDEVNKQLVAGATAGQVRLNGTHTHGDETCSAITRVKWSLDGDIEVA